MNGKSYCFKALRKIRNSKNDNHPVMTVYVIDTYINNLEQRTNAVDYFNCSIILYKAILQPYSGAKDSKIINNG